MDTSFDYKKLMNEQKALLKRSEEIDNIIKTNIDNIISSLFTQTPNSLINLNIPEHILTLTYNNFIKGFNKTISIEGIEAINQSSYETFKKQVFEREISRITKTNIQEEDLKKINKMIPDFILPNDIHNSIISFFGVYKLDNKKHPNLLKYIYKNSFNLLLGFKANNNKNKTKVHATIEEIYNNSKVQSILKTKTPEEKLEFYSKNIVESFSYGNVENYFFFIDRIKKENIDIKNLFQSKKLLNEILLNGHKHDGFFIMLQDVLKYVPNDFEKYLSLRTAISVQHNDTMGFLFTKCTTEDILNIKKLFQQILGDNFNQPRPSGANGTRYNNYKNAYEEIFKVLLHKTELELSMPINTNSSSKITIKV